MASNFKSWTLLLIQMNLSLYVVQGYKIMTKNIFSSIVYSTHLMSTNTITLFKLLAQINSIYFELPFSTWIMYPIIKIIFFLIQSTVTVIIKQFSEFVFQQSLLKFYNAWYCFKFDILFTEHEFWYNRLH